ncbi:MAG: hypothetical protein ACFE0J_05790 [Elainellaceae cyanobacterium]
MITKRLGLSIAALAIALLIGIGLITSQTKSHNSASQAVTMGRPFDLNLDQTVTVEPSDLNVTLLNIEDSRCPSGVQCPWEGQVTTTLEVRRGDSVIRQIDLTRHVGQRELATQSIDGYSLELIEVDPHPQAERSLEPSDYAATFMLTDVVSQD